MGFWFWWGRQVEVPILWGCFRYQDIFVIILGVIFGGCSLGRVGGFLLGGVPEIIHEFLCLTNDWLAVDDGVSC